MILDDSEFIEISKLVWTKSYNQNFNGFLKLLRITRNPFLKNRKFFIRGVQMGMLKSLDEFQKAQKEYKKQLSLIETKEEKTLIQKNILIEKEWIRVLKTIADGIAWRAFDFDRPLLKHMSENQVAGSIEQVDYDYLEVLKNNLKTLPGFPIVNDLTNTLRVADFTVIYSDDSKILYEIKEKGKKIYDVGQIFNEINKSKKIPKPQKLKHLNTQMSIIERKIRLSNKDKNSSELHDFEASVVDLDFPIKHHFKKLIKLIKKADRKGMSAQIVEDGYFICVVAVDKMKNKKKRNFINKEFKKSYPDWSKNNPNVISVSNYDSFFEKEGQFARAVLPYSVLPLSSKNCLRLMMGHLWVTIVFDNSKIKEKLLNKGWEVSDNKAFKDIFEKGYVYSKEDSIYERVDKEKIFNISYKDENGIFNSGVSITETLMAIHSFYSTDFIIDVIEQSYKKASINRSSGYFARNYIGERKILI